MKKSLLHYLSAIVLVVLISFTNNHPKHSTAGKEADMDVVKKRILDDLLEPQVNATEIKQLITTIQPDGTWPGINYKDVSRTGFEHRIHLENMVDLSRAYRKTGSEFYKNADVKKTVAAALDFWIKNDFICDNWWWNEMGTPGHMINTLLLMDDALTEEQRRDGLKIARRANLEASGARPGGDLIVIAAMLGKQALFYNNPDTLDRVIKVMASEIKVSTGRGLKPDMSFHHRVDNVTSTLTYGTNYINTFAYWAVKTTGTKYALPTDVLQLLVDYYLDGICSFMVYGKYPDPGAKNRDLSRRGSLNAWGPELPQNLMKATSYRAKELQAIIDIRNDKAKPALSADHFFWHSEYYSHQRPTYFTSVRMHSSRNYTMEQPHNEEGLKNHHYGDGANFISITGKEYVDVFPVWDWFKIPGTTVVQKSELPHWNQIAKKGLTDFVGGVTDGKYGAAVFDFASPHDPVKAHKAWFFFDKEYVCLGNGINSTADEPVATTLNQCLLNGDITAKTSAGVEKISKGNHTVKNTSWVVHNNVAYIFPTSTQVHLDNTTATGNWRQITHQAWATEEPVQKDLFCLWLDHGVKPTNASYEYIIVPNADTKTAETYSKKPVVGFLNTADVQMAGHGKLGLTQAVFYKATSIGLNKEVRLSVDNACMVMIEMKGPFNFKKITVSDPTHKLSTLQLTIGVIRFEGSGNNWKAEWDANKKATIITIDLPKEGYAGKSVVIEKK